MVRHVTSFGILLCIYPELISGIVLSNNHERITNETERKTNSNEDTKGQMSTIVNKHIPNMHDIDYRARSDSLQSMISESSVSSQIASTSINEKSPPKKYLEILVHNVSHTDLILGLSGESPEVLLHPKSVTAVVSSSDTNHETPRSKNSRATDVDRDSNADDEKLILCRPRFSAFDMFSQRVLNKVSHNGVTLPLNHSIISYPRYERSGAATRYTLVTPRPSDQFMLPIGFNLEQINTHKDSANLFNVKKDALSLDCNDMQSLRLRGRDISKVDPALIGDSPRLMTKLSPLPYQTVATSSEHKPKEMRINAVFFPLLSTLLPRWLGQISDKFGSTETVGKPLKHLNVISTLPQNQYIKKVIVLVSGVGSPRNWTHSIHGNSTQSCAELMELFINTLFPEITVIKIHSLTDIFRYDENISFATHELLPCIDSYRDAHARSEPYPDEITDNKKHLTTNRNPFDSDWRQYVSISYSFADGSAARTHAIQAALRPYRPTYFHFWQLKTFWHQSKITTEDIEVHSFEEMETVPAMAVDQTSGAVLVVVNEMKSFRRDFLETQKTGRRSDMKNFWLRKTKKPVLAVLLVQKPDGSQVLYRGTNMEVSMPTGSLCAERNVIGTALASDPGLKREDLLMLAVLSVQLPEEKKPPPPPSVLFSSPVKDVDFIFKVNEKLKQMEPCDAMPGAASFSGGAIIAEKRSLDEREYDVNQNNADDGKHEVNTPQWTIGDSENPAPSQTSTTLPPIDYCNRSGTSTPKRHVSLYKFADMKNANLIEGSSHDIQAKVQVHKKLSHLGGIVKNKKRLLLAQSLDDINPLKPCGACNEWLKKIAESNPHFKVLTFTDTKCNGVYVSPCQE